MPHQPPFEDLLGRLASSRDDKEAWNLLYKNLWPSVKATTYRALGGSHNLAEDAAQEVFLRLLLYCDFRKFRNMDEFRRYLYAVSKNVVNDILNELHGQLVDISEQEAELQRMFPTETPEQRAVSRQILDKIWSELDTHDKDLASLVVQGYKMNEIAEKLCWTTSNVGVRLHRLRLHLVKLKKTGVLG